MTALRDVSTADLLAEVQHRWQDDTGPLHQLAPMLGSIRELHQHVEPRPADAPAWSCGRCDSFAARGFDDGQIPEHHHTCQHAGVGAGPLGDAVAAVLGLHEAGTTYRLPNGRSLCADCAQEWPCATVDAIAAAGVTS